MSRGKPLKQRVLDRLELDGLREDPSTLNMVADVLYEAAVNSEDWTKRGETAKRITDMLYEVSDSLRSTARNSRLAKAR